MRFENTDSDAVDVLVAELLVATADHADAMIDPAVREVLGLVRDKMNMDVVFVRVFRPGSHASGDDGGAPPEADPLEATWGQQVLADRMLQAAPPQGTWQHAPVVMAHGAVYGTLCGFSRDGWAVQRDATILRSTAQLIAHKLDQPAASRGSAARPAAGRRRRSVFETEATLPLETSNPA